MLRLKKIVRQAGKWYQEREGITEKTENSVHYYELSSSN